MMQSSAFAELAGQRLRAITPALLGFSVILLATVPYPWVTYVPIFPSLILMVLYYWTMYQPQSVPGWYVFALGLWLDILTKPLLGLSPLLFLFLRYLILSHHRWFSQSLFWGVWLGFTLHTILFFALEYTVYSMVYSKWIYPQYALLTAAITISAYPLVHLLNNRIYRWMHGRRGGWHAY